MAILLFLRSPLLNIMTLSTKHTTTRFSLGHPSRPRLAYDIHIPKRQQHHHQGGNTKPKIRPVRGPQPRERSPIPRPRRTRLHHRNTSLPSHSGSLYRRPNSQTDRAAKLSDGIDQRPANSLVLPRQGLRRKQRQARPHGIGAHDGEHHGWKPVRPVRRRGRNGHGVQQTRNRCGEGAADEDKQRGYTAEQLRDNQGDDHARHTSWYVSQHGGQRRQALEVLEEVGRKDEVVVEGGEEEAHDEHGGGEACVSEHGDLDERRAGEVAPVTALEVHLPCGEEGDEQDGRDDEDGHPGRGPADDVAFCEGEVECYEGDGDERCA